MKIVKINKEGSRPENRTPGLYWADNIGWYGNEISINHWLFSMYVLVDGQQHPSNSEHYYKSLNDFRYNIDGSFGGKYREDY